MTKVARFWYTVIVLVGVASVVAQLTLVVQGVDVLVPTVGAVASTGMRVWRFFSYFTIQSNLLVILTSATLLARPDRDGALWRVVRLDALIGITVTGIVYVAILHENVKLTGISWLTNVAFHFVIPAMAVLGWVMFGPRPRIDTRTLVLSTIWPVAYMVYILFFGAKYGWYPYPFIDVGTLGYPVALRNAALVVLVLLIVGAILRLLDRLPRTG